MIKVAVVCGGNSGEKVISMKSSLFVIESLNPKKYQGYQVLIEGSDWNYIAADGTKAAIDKNDFSFTLAGEKTKFDVVFNIIHGDPGENGKLQAYFEMLGIPNTSSDSTVSALTFNKAYCNHIVRDLKVNVAASMHLFKSQQVDEEAILNHVGIPCFVKPNSGGSSIGMSKVNKPEELLPAIEKAFAEDEEILIEEFFEGRELTCGLMQTGKEMVVFPICEIISKKEFFDYEAKYQDDLVEELIPAPIEASVAEVIKANAVYLYKSLHLGGVARIDFIFNDDDYIFLEVNTIPGLSAQSIVPNMARAYGWTNEELIERIIEEAF
jgi:D-alanine-D-alanine ligase